MTYPLTCNTWGQEEVDALHRVIASGNFTMGARTREFQAAFAQKVGARFAVMVSSGSAANLVATAAMRYRKNRPLQPGDEVLVPAISWATTYYPLSQHGLKLRFVDVDLHTLNMDVSQLEAALTPRTRMLVAVSILGNPAALDVMRAFCDKHGLYFFEDNCESMGATLNGKQCGTFGDVNTFSTFFSHHISTMEGGVIVTDQEEIYQLCLSLRAHGWTRDLPENSLLHERRADDFFEAYRFILPGFNARPLELSAAAGVEQLKKLDRMVEIRRQNAGHFVSLFKDHPHFIIQKENGRSSWFSFTMIVRPDSPLKREAVLARLKQNNIMFRIITGGNFLRHDVIKHIPHSVHGTARNADIAHDRGFFVGNFPEDARDKIDLLWNTLKEFR